VTKEFSIQTYERLLTEIGRAGWKVFTLKEYFEQRQTPDAFLILRHDVDRRPGRALRMALAENSRGIRSTYYFRVNPRVFRADLVLRIASMGHEIGYHYEVLDKAGGSVPLAKRLFTEELARMRSVTDVKTASMHGNPLSPWDNRDFWLHHEPAEFGLEGEAYVSIRDREILYVTDTGGGWNRVHDNVYDRLPSGTPASTPPFQSTQELMQALGQGMLRKVYLQVHPNRWTAGPLEVAIQRAEDFILNRLKTILKHRRRRSPDR
jgi:hypothetical protein